MVSHAKPVSARFVCDAKDELMATVYNDPYFSQPRNHKSRDQLIMRILRADRRLPGKRLAGLILNEAMKSQNGEGI